MYLDFLNMRFNHDQSQSKPAWSRINMVTVARYRSVLRKVFGELALAKVIIERVY